MEKGLRTEKRDLGDSGFVSAQILNVLAKVHKIPSSFRHANYVEYVEQFCELVNPSLRETQLFNISPVVFFLFSFGGGGIELIQQKEKFLFTRLIFLL